MDFSRIAWESRKEGEKERKEGMERGKMKLSHQMRPEYTTALTNISKEKLVPGL